MKNIKFYSVTGSLAVISILLFIVAIATDNQYKIIDTLVVIFFVATFFSIPVLLLISWIFKKKD